MSRVRLRYYANDKLAKPQEINLHGTREKEAKAVEYFSKIAILLTEQ